MRRYRSFSWKIITPDPTQLMTRNLYHSNFRIILSRDGAKTANRWTRMYWAKRKHVNLPATSYRNGKELTLRIKIKSRLSFNQTRSSMKERNLRKLGRSLMALRRRQEWLISWKLTHSLRPLFRRQSSTQKLPALSRKQLRTWLHRLFSEVESNRRIIYCLPAWSIKIIIKVTYLSGSLSVI